MSQETYRAAIAAHWAEETDGAHDLGHLDRVWASAQEIALELGGRIWQCCCLPPISMTL